MPFDFTQVDADPVVLALVRAKARIADPKNWCRDGDNSYRPGETFCALLACKPGDGSMTTLSNAARELFDRSVIEVNDTLGHAAVMQVYDKAIDMARARALAKSTP